MNVDMWSLEKWYRGKHLQGRKKDTENGLADMGLGDREG